MSLCVFPTRDLELKDDRVFEEPEPLGVRQVGPFYENQVSVATQEVSSAFTNSQWTCEVGVGERR